MRTFRSDRPIGDRQSDLLGRGPLVNAIVAQILGAPPDGKAVTIGLNAQWGAGKSSFLNLVQERLNKVGSNDPSNTDANGRPIVIRFNPWLFGSIEQLTRMFFNDLSRAVKISAPKENVGVLLETFGDLVTAASTVFPTGAAELARLLAGQAKAFGQQARKPPGLNEQKKKIDRKLAQLPQRIVVFIDDVDRLEPDLTTLFFRMVRLNANFNNMTYVLAFDRSVVERHLAHDSPGFGREYLEKIIQVSYNIPPPHPRIIPSLLMAEMVDVRRAIEKTVFDEPRYERLFDDRRYKLVFDAGFSKHFTTVRSIKRYVNALRLTLPPVVGKVDLVDFYVIELIRLSYPDVYVEITQQKEMLLASVNHDDDVAERQQWLRGLTIPAHLWRSMHDLLCILFPALDRGGTQRGHDEALRLRWARDRRVCSHAAFDRFFSLAGEAADSDTIDVGERVQVSSVEEVQRVLERARRTGRVLEVLCAVRHRRLEANAAKALSTVICNSDPRDDLQLPDVQDSYEVVCDVMANCLRWYGRGREYQFLSRLTKNGGSIFAVSKAFEGIEDLDNIVGQHAPLLRKDLVDRILALAASEGFWDGNRWYYLLNVACRLGEEDGVLGVVRRRIRGDDGEWYDDHLLGICEVFPEAVRHDHERGGAESREEDIRRWLPGDARDRLEEIAKEDGENGVRASAILKRVWPG